MTVMRFSNRPFLASALIAAAIGSTASAQNYDMPMDEVSSVTLLPGWMRADGIYIGAILIELEPGWKTYWRAPGGNGIPPAFDWSQSDNLSQVGYFWPTPTIFDTFGTRTFGYESDVVLPIAVRPGTGDAMIQMDLTMDYGVCADICVPARSEVTAVFDPGNVQNRDIIEAALADRPATAKESGVMEAKCGLSPAEENFVLSANVEFETAPNNPVAVVIESGSEEIWVSMPDHSVEGSAIALEADVQYYGDGTMPFDRSDVRITMIGEAQTIEIRGCNAG